MLRKRILQQASEALRSTDRVSRTTPRTAYFRLFKGSKRWIQLLGGILFLVYGAFPAAFYFSGWFRRFLIFGHYINWPPLINFNDTDAYELPYTRSLFIESADNIALGTWHVMPRSEWHRCANGVHPDAEFQDSRPVIIYYHGHAETRATDYRVQLYRRLSQSIVDAHVIAFDYRGFGDSTNVMPSRHGVIQDSLAVYEWVKRKVPNSRIVIWGHSLGTGVAIQLGEIFARTGDNPAAIVLEAPFNSLVEAALRWPLSIPFRFIPGTRKILEPLLEEDTNFESEQKAGTLTAPVLVLHSKDDPLVPYDLGRKLYERLQRDRPSHLPAAVFYDVDSSVGPGHRRIYKDPKFPEVVSGFIKSVVR
ncbi:unnamed protein product [Ixodes pacificus]